MKTRWQVCSAFFLAMLLVGSMAGDGFAQFNGRAAVAGRQKVRALLAVAMADGRLSRMEQYSILLKAKDLLLPGELRGLQATMDRLAGCTPLLSDSPQPAVPGNRGVENIGRLTLTGVDARGEAETASYQESATPDPEDSPFKEEDLPLRPIPNPVEQFEEYRNQWDDAYGDGCGCGDGCDGGCGDGCDGGCAFAHERMLCDYMPTLYCEAIGNTSLSMSIDAFKGPMDLDNQNGNFGINFAFNSGIALSRGLGVGVQAGTSGVLSDFHGTQFTGSTIRQQNFTTVGLYRRNPFQTRGLNFGFAFDWLHDKYYASFDMSQWRVQLSYEFNACEEFGIWACIPNDGETVSLDVEDFERFKPVAQGNVFYTRNWLSGRSLTAWIGVAEEPGEFVFGGSGRIPLTCRTALVASLNYVLPSAGGIAGQDEEMWNVSLGIELRPSPMTRGCGRSRFAPLFPLANNGTFAIRRY